MNARTLSVRGLAALAAVFSGCGIAVAGQQPYVAEVMTTGANFCPRGWAPMNGQTLPINQNQALFSLLGTSYGGDGRSNFALPLAPPVFTADHRPLLSCIALQGIFPPRD